MEKDYLISVKKQFEYYKILAEKTIEQVPEEALFWHFNAESNSIATIVKHMSGNMVSRWTNFLTTDGEKEWRNREAEFENDLKSKSEILAFWQKGWQCLFEALNSLTTNDLTKIIYIRNLGQTAMDAINRQLAHYPYHIGQIVFIGKMAMAENWTSLSIPRGKSTEYNAEKFASPPKIEHFAKEILENKGKN